MSSTGRCLMRPHHYYYYYVYYARFNQVGGNSQGKARSTEDALTFEAAPASDIEAEEDTSADVAQTVSDLTPLLQPLLM